jgi:hypothetical protein
VTPDHVDLGKGASLPVSQGGKFQLPKGTWKGSKTNLGALLIRLVRIQVQIQACIRKLKGRLITSQRHPSNTLFGDETMSFRFKEQGRSTVLCESV